MLLLLSILFRFELIMPVSDFYARLLNVLPGFCKFAPSAALFAAFCTLIITAVRFANFFWRHQALLLLLRLCYIVAVNLLTLLLRLSFSRIRNFIHLNIDVYVC